MDAGLPWACVPLICIARRRSVRAGVLAGRILEESGAGCIEHVCSLGPLIFTQLVCLPFGSMGYLLRMGRDWKFVLCPPPLPLESGL